MTAPNNHVVQLVCTQLAVGAALFATVWSVGTAHQAASLLIGAVLMAANVAVLGWVWNRLIGKKSIALTVAVIVIKYTVLLGSILYLARAAWFSAVGAGLGIASIAIAAVIHAVRWRKQE